MLTDLMQPGEELEFYRKGILDFTQKLAEAITTKGEYIGDWIDIPQKQNNSYQNFGKNAFLLCIH